VNKLLITKKGKITGFEAMLNPTSLKLTHGINYSNCADRAMGSIAQEVKFVNYSEDTLTFDFLLDGTGAVKDVKPLSALERLKNTIDPKNMIAFTGLSDASSTSIVTDKITALKKIIYEYEGKEHEPNIIDVHWGTLLFTCRLEGMSIDYTLFSSDGAPLRAKIGLSFKGYSTTVEGHLKAKKSSPDLTHIIEVKVGDTLPLLCHKIYKDESYYLEVAKHNNLLSFRNLTPGQTLYFPPLN